MSAGLFTLTCPECGTEMHPDEVGRSTCPACQRRYLNRFGHLIPVPRGDADRQGVVGVNGGRP